MAGEKKDLRTGNAYWASLPVPQIPFSPLDSDKKTDVVIIGAGISGAMVAESLASTGLKVILLDRRGPLLGATAATTALLQYELDNPLTLLRKKIGTEKAMRAWRRSRLGLESLSAKVQGLGIQCGMKRVPSLYLTGNVLNSQQMQEEGEWRSLIGLHSDFLQAPALKDAYGIHRAGALRCYDNFTANPVRMAAGFLKGALKHGAKIYAPVVAEKVEQEKGRVVVHTQGGPTISAKNLIYATGYEVPPEVSARGHKIHSTYAITTRPQPDNLWPQKCLIWEAAEPYLYLRVTPDGRIICGGEDESFEDEEKRDRLLPQKTARLEKALSKLFPHIDSRAEYAWCGSFGVTASSLPTIGEVPGMPNCFAILAFGGNGITFSRIAAEVLTLRLTGKEDPDTDLFAF